MLFDPKYDLPLGRLEAQLRSARAPTTGLLSDVIAEACDSLPECETAAKPRINRLIAAGAWTDAALALVQLELPQWSLRRIVYEDGEWHCCLSRQPQLPLGFDEVAEASHEILSLAWSRSWKQDATPLRARRRLPPFHTLAQRQIWPCVATTLPDPRAHHAAAKVDHRACS